MQASEGLEQCHQQGLFHGLLKPSNLMIGSDGQVRILDFGIGCLLAETEGESLVDTMSTANSVNSGLDCASPESIMDPTNLTPIGDQYSLGCVLYYFLVGRYPFPDGTAVEKMMSHQHKQPTPIKELNPEAPDGLVAVVEKLMQKSPANRYASCAEVIEALRPFAGVTTPSRRATMAMPRVKLPRPDAPRPATAPSVPPRELPRPRGAQPVPPRPAPASKLPRSEHGQRPAVAAAEPPVAAAPAIAPTIPQPAAEPARLPIAQRIGTMGILLLAVLAGIAAYFLSSLLNIKF
jgi:serine/threonine-protein kinase